MRTNIDIDGEVLERVMAISGETTKKGAVDAALRHFIKLDQQREALDETRGMGWVGDLDKMRGG